MNAEEVSGLRIKDLQENKRKICQIFLIKSEIKLFALNSFKTIDSKNQEKKNFLNILEIKFALLRA
jgi:hypothetical protein